MPAPIQGQVKFRVVEEFGTALGYSIKAPRPDATHLNFYTPRNLFLIYIMQAPDGKLDVRHMFDYGVDDIPTAEIELATLAKNSTQTPAYVGRNFKQILWRYPCYVTVVLDVLGLRFYGENDISKDPIVFNEIKDGVTYASNFSFFNCEHLNILNCSAIRFTNYLKSDANGADIVLESELYTYSMDINLIWGLAGTTDVLKIIVDPDGQNQGPPSVP